MGWSPSIRISVAWLFLCLLHQGYTQQELCFSSPLERIEHCCPAGWTPLENSYLCQQLFATPSQQFDGLNWRDSLQTCLNVGATLIDLQNFGQNQTFGEDEPSDLLQIMNILREMNLRWTWLGANYLNPEPTDTIIDWNLKRPGTIYELFWGNFNEPSVTRNEAKAHYYEAVVSLSLDDFWKRYYYDYGAQILSSENKLPFFCTMAAPLRNHFHCLNNLRNVPIGLKCNGINDCGDDSDEMDCTNAQLRRCRSLIQLDSGTEGGSAVIAKQGFGENEECIWVVRAQLGHGIRLDIEEFSVTPALDVVDVFVGGPTLALSNPVPLVRLSRNPQQSRFYGYNDYMIVKLNSNAAAPTNGFRLRVTQLQNNPVWDTVLSDDQVAGSFPGTTECSASSYLRAGQRYTWNFRAVTSRTLTFQIVGMRLCAGDFVEVRDGFNSQRARLFRYNGSDPWDRWAIASTKPNIHVYLFTSNTTCVRGCFDFTVRQGCLVNISSVPSTTVASPGYETFIVPRYAQNVECRYYLGNPNTVATASLTGNDFELNPEDYVQIYDGIVLPGQEASATPRGGRLTGSSIPGQVDTNQGQLTIVFFSSRVGNLGRGFLFTYARDCELPTFNANTMYSGATVLRTGAQLRITCAAGYFFAQEEHYLVDPAVGVLITCQQSEWNVRVIPSCERRWCGWPPLDQSSFVDVALSRSQGMMATPQYEAGLRFGDRLFYDCFGGLGVANNPLTCQSNGFWRQPFPVCQVRTCTLPSQINPPNRRYEILNQAQGFDGQRINSVLRFICDDGYELDNVDLGETTFCTASGLYHINPTQFTCTPKRCPLADIPNGLWISPSVQINNVASWQCNVGYNDKNRVPVSGSGTVRCQANETLEYTPECTDINECNLATACPGCTNTEGSFACNCEAEGFELVGGVCRDINECIRNTHNCGDPLGCSNIGGGFLCRCTDPNEQLFVANGTGGFYIPWPETGLRTGDLYVLNRTCVPRTCAIPTIDMATSVAITVQQSFEVGLQLQIDCILGFQLQTRSPGSASDITYTMTCLADGSWNAIVPTCLPATCQIPQAYELIVEPFIAPATLPDGSTRVFQLGEVIEYGQTFMLNACIDNRVPDSVKMDARIFPQVATCIFDPINDVYRIDLVADVPFNQRCLQANSFTTAAQLESLRLLALIASKATPPTCALNAMDCALYVVSCDVPLVIPQSMYTAETGGVYNSDRRFLEDGFFVSCASGTVAGMSDGVSNPQVTRQTVRCQDTGVWSYGSLRCPGGLCPWPGRVAEANLEIVDSSGTSFPANTPYSVGTFASYNCWRTGYEPVPNTLRECISTAGVTSWTGSLPECRDVAPPVFTNCPTGVVDVEPWEPNGIPDPIITDNSGADQDSLTVTVDPAGFNSMTVMGQLNPPGTTTVNVTYTATDAEGMSSVCSFLVRPRNKVAPNIVCPSNARIIITREGVNDDFIMPFATGTDDMTPASQLTYSTEPAVVSGLTPANVGDILEFQSTVSDADGNTAICNYTVQVEAEPCSSFFLPEIANGVKTSVQQPGGGWTITYVCVDGYVFYFPEENTQVYTCSPGSGFTPNQEPFCQRPEPGLWAWTHNIVYCATGGIGSNYNEPACLAEYATRLVDALTLDFALDSTTDIDFVGCGTVIRSRASQWRLVPERTFLNPANILFSGCPNPAQAIDWQYQVEHYIDEDVLALEGLTLSDIFSGEYSRAYFLDQECYSTLINRVEPLVNNMFLEIGGMVVPPFVTGGISCPGLDSGSPTVFSNHIANLSRFSCGPFDKIVRRGFVNGQPLLNATLDCYGPPPGTFPNITGNDVVNQLVPVNTFKAEAGAISACPVGTTARCLDDTPCTGDPAVDYIIWCTCPVGTGTYATGATSIDDCVFNCATYGMISRDPLNGGLSPCVECPRDNYPMSPTECSPCPLGSGTGSTRATQQSECRAECGAGSISADGFEPAGGSCTMCPRGFYQPMSRQRVCLECRPVETTLNTASSQQAQCLTIGSAAVGCNRARCSNQGTCTIELHQLICNCDAGFTGDLCQNRIDVCASSPCFYDAPCTLDTSTRGYNCNCNLSPNYNDTSGTRCEVDGDNTNLVDCGFNDARGSARDLLNGQADCNCNAGFGGPLCTTTSDACMPDPCQNGGVCQNYDGVRFECQCPDGWGGSNGTCAVNIDECLSSPCKQGVCVDLVNGYRCDCPNGFTGDTCQTLVPLCPAGRCQNAQCLPDFEMLQGLCVCDPGFEPAPGTLVPNRGMGVSTSACVPQTFCTPTNPCENNGVCSEWIAPLDGGGEVARFLCTCPQGFEGHRCQHNRDECVPNQCVNGTCIDGTNTFTCDCDQGFEGTLCDRVIDMCSGFTCMSPGTVPGTVNCDTDISVRPPRPQCRCRAGYTGQRCETNINDCVYGDQTCFHGGTCLDGVNAFQCQCSSGWTGLRCQDNINNCTTSPCRNGGTCYDLHDDYRCVCPPSFAGRDCDQTTDLCTEIMSCYEGATCMSPSSGNPNYTCICPPQRTGAHCELLRDGCLNNPCENGGTCAYDDLVPGGFTCTCLPGYTGATCAVVIDNCAGLNCPANRPCLSDVITGLGVCQCGPLRAPPTCDSDLDVERDYGFLTPGGRAIPRPYALPLGANIPLNFTEDFSLGFGVRFLRRGGVGNFLSFFAQPNPMPALDPNGRLLFRFTETFMYITNVATGNIAQRTYNGEQGEIYFPNIGSWIYIVVTYNHSASLLNVWMETTNTVEDHVVSFPISGVTGSPYSYGSIEVGNYENATGSYPFEGFVSYPCLWNRVLGATEIQQLAGMNNFQSRRDTIFVNLRPGLSGCFQLDPLNGAQVYEDPAGQSDLGETSSGGIGGGGIPGGVEPQIPNCPTEPIIVRSASPGVRPQFYVPPPELYNVTDGTVRAELGADGGFLINGTTREVIVATAPGGRTAVCYFDIIVQLYQCTDQSRVQQPLNNQQASIIRSNTADGNPSNFYYLPQSCPSGFAFSHPVPSFYTCSPFQSAFNTYNFRKRFNQPQCGQVFIPRITVKIRYQMPEIFPCDDLNEFGGITTDILSKGTELNRLYRFKAGEGPAGFPSGLSAAIGPFCGLTGNCETDPNRKLNQTQQCLTGFMGRRKRQTDTRDPQRLGMTAEIVHEDLPILLLDVATGGEVSTSQVLFDYWIAQNRIFTTTVILAGLNPAATEFVESLVCDYGQELRFLGDDVFGVTQWRCVDCAPGEYWVPSDEPPLQDLWGYCLLAPFGYYTENFKTVGVGNLTRCPPGFTTEQPGTARADLCIGDPGLTTGCSPGSFYNRVTARCQLCPVGFFQSERDEDFCWECPATMSTTQTGRTTVRDCEPICPVGTELIGTDCQVCQRGFYRNNLDVSGCVECPNPFTTPDGGAGDHDSSLDCNLYNCTVGTIINSLNNGCDLCPNGTYQDEIAQQTCKDCPLGLTTESRGASSLSSCQRDCPAGQQTEGTVCGPCPQGTYKTTSGVRPCTACPSERSTPNTGSTRQQDCTVRFCNRGRYDSGSDCRNCPDATYQSELGRSGISSCISCTCPLSEVCPNGTTYTTGGSGGEAFSDCRVFDPCTSCYGPGTERCVRSTTDGTAFVCRCRENFEGARCAVRKDPEGDTPFIIGGVIGAAALILLLLLLALWICWCFRNRRVAPSKAASISVAPTIYTPYPVPVYDAMPFASQPVKVGTPVMAPRSTHMYFPANNGFYGDGQGSLTGYNAVVAQPERLYAEQARSTYFYEDPSPEEAAYSSRLPGGNTYQGQGAGVAAFSDGGLTDIYASVNKMN